MNQRVLRLWIEALMSQRYNQGQHYLHRNDTYCCLGVLVDLYIKEHGLQWQRNWRKTCAMDDGLHGLNDQYGVLPEAVIQWAELTSHDPFVIVNEQRYRLSLLNDSYRLPFEDIAKILGKTYLMK